MDRRKDFKTRALFESLLSKMTREELLEAAMDSFFDTLTGLPKRNALSKSLELMGDDVMFCLIDIDNFKFINDVFGHQAGDQILIKLSKIMELESLGHAYRLGGDEFLIVDSEPSIRAVIDRIRHDASKVDLYFTALRDYKEIEEGSLVIKKGIDISVGIGKEIQDADAAMLNDKKEREITGIRSVRGRIPRGYSYVPMERLREIYDLPETKRTKDSQVKWPAA